MPTHVSLRPVGRHCAAGALVATTLAAAARRRRPQADRADDACRLARGPAHRRARPQRPVRLRRLRADRSTSASASTRSAATARTVPDDRDALADHVDSYTTGVDFGEPTTCTPARSPRLRPRPGAGRDPRAFGGADLVRASTTGSAPTARSRAGFADKGAGDYTNTIGQSFAARGTRRGRLPKAEAAIAVPAPAAVRRRVLPAEPRGAGRREAGLRRGAARARGARHRRDRARRAQPPRAAAQLPDGTGAEAIADATAGCGSGRRTTAASAAAPAPRAATPTAPASRPGSLGDAGACRPAARAARWVRDLQVVDAAGTSLDGEDGAIAYDAAGYAAGEDGGISDDERDQWRRATAQAAPGLSYLRVADCS